MDQLISNRYNGDHDNGNHDNDNYDNNNHNNITNPGVSSENNMGRSDEVDLLYLQPQTGKLVKLAWTYRQRDQV